jgi:PadR family transcriptional regulator PadR
MPRRKAGAILPFEYEVLSAGLTVQSVDGSFYGFALAQALIAGDDGRALTSHGTLYKALARMTEAGLLDSEWEDPDVAEAAGRPRRRLYRVSGAGALALRQRDAIGESTRIARA